MTAFDLTLHEGHLDTLRDLVMRDDGIEGAAYMLCGVSRIGCDPWERQSSQRFTSFEVAAIPQKDRISASDRHITWSTSSFVHLLRKAKNSGLIPAIIHSHPRGPAAFSEQDNRNERDLVQLAQNRNGPGASLLSILLAGDGQIVARLWLDCRTHVAVEVRSVGRRLTFYSVSQGADVDFLARQALAFGAALNKTLRQMRVGIVGCGGTGSATAMLLARLGVGQIALFDDDIVEATNLNRLHGARRADQACPARHRHSGASRLYRRRGLVPGELMQMGCERKLMSLPARLPVWGLAFAPFLSVVGSGILLPGTH